MSWIPFNDRLPTTGWHLVTLVGGEVGTLWFNISGNGTCWLDHSDNDVPATKVIAWQPLPEPYQKPRRFVVVEDGGDYGPFRVQQPELCALRVHYVANFIPTREAAERIADIYEESYT